MPDPKQNLTADLFRKVSSMGPAPTGEGRNPPPPLSIDPINPILQTLADPLGLGQSNAGNSVISLGKVPAVSMFATKEARDFGLSQFRKLVGKMPPLLQEGFEAFAKKYPRVAAHMAPEYVPDYGTFTRAQTWMPGGGKVEQAIPVKVYKQVLDDVFNMPKGKYGHEAAFHEGTHVAQRLGNKKAGPLHNLAGELTQYDNIPLETSALQGAALRDLGLPAEYSSIPMQPLIGGKAVQYTRGLANRTKQSGAALQQPAANNILRILAERDRVAQENLKRLGLKFPSTPISRSPHTPIGMAAGQPLPPTVKALIDQMRKPIEIPDPAVEFGKEKFTGYLPRRGQIKVPKGWELPGEDVQKFMARDPKLVERYVTERNQSGHNPFMPALQPVQQLATQQAKGIRATVANRSTSKMTEDIVREIRALTREGKNLKDLQAKYPHINRETLRDVFKGDSWAWIK